MLQRSGSCDAASVISPNLSLRNLSHYFSNIMFLHTVAFFSPTLLLYMIFAMMIENILTNATLYFSAAIFGGEIRNIRFPQTPCSWSSPLRFPSVGRWSPGLAISMSREDKAGRNSVSTHPQNWNISLKSCRIFFYTRRCLCLRCFFGNNLNTSYFPPDIQ